MKRSTIIFLSLFIASLVWMGYLIYNQYRLQEKGDQLYPLVKEARGDLNDLKSRKEMASNATNDYAEYFSYEIDYDLYTIVKHLREGDLKTDSLANLSIVTLDKIQKEDPTFFENVLAYAVNSSEEDKAFSLKDFWREHKHYTYYDKGIEEKVDDYYSDEDIDYDEEESLSTILEKYLVKTYTESFRDPEKLNRFFNKYEDDLYQFMSKDFYDKMFKGQVEELLKTYHETKNVEDRITHFNEILDKGRHYETWATTFWYRRHLEGNTREVFRILDALDVHYD